MVTMQQPENLNIIKDSANLRLISVMNLNIEA